jgi:hypothetical protein
MASAVVDTMRSTSAVSTTRRSSEVAQGRRLRRWIASVAVIGVAAHVFVAALGSGSLVTALVFAGMATLCLPCAVHVWSRDSRRALVLVGINAAGMVAVHAALIALMYSAHGVSTMDHGAHHAHSASTGDTQLVALTVLEASVAAGALWATRRPTRPSAA